MDRAWAVRKLSSEANAIGDCNGEKVSRSEACCEDDMIKKRIGWLVVTNCAK